MRVYKHTPSAYALYMTHTVSLNYRSRSARLGGAVAKGRGGIVVAAAAGVGAVGPAVGAVAGGVVGGTVAIGAATVVAAAADVAGRVDGSGSISNADHIGRDEDDQEQHAADHDGHVESDADAGVVLLRVSLGRQRHDGQDEGGDDAAKVEERGPAADQREDGEDQSAYRHSGVVFGRRRHDSGGSRIRLRRHHDDVVVRNGSGLRLEVVAGLARLVVVGRWRVGLALRRVRLALRRVRLALRRVRLTLRRVCLVRRRVGLALWWVGLVGIHLSHSVQYCSQRNPKLTRKRTNWACTRGGLCCLT